MQDKILSELLATLRDHDTPTVCNAIEVAQGKRGFAAFTRGTVVCATPGDGPIVGFAQTARIAGIHPADESPEATRARRIEYFRHMATGKQPAVAVIEDTDSPDCVAAWWGEVHTAVHKGLGMVGAVTNGVVRDLDTLEPGFPVVAGSIGPSHRFCHVRDIGTRVEVFGLTVEDGDLIHADRHGALVIPQEVIPRLQASIENLLATEQIILEPARRPGFDIDELERAWADFEKSRT